MKIAYLLGSLNRGGTETLLLDIFRNAASNKLDAIGIYRKTGVCEQDFCTSGVPMIALKPGKNFLKYLFKLRTILKNNKINVVHAQQPLDALLAYFALLGTGIKIVLTLHGFDYNEKSIGKLIHFFILKRTDSNIYVSSYQRDYYTKKYQLIPEKQQVVYNGISFDKLNINPTTQRVTQRNPLSELAETRGATRSHTPNNQNLRTELNLPAETLLIGTVGNFNLVRDQFTICRFLKLLADEDINFHFVFVGKKIDALSERYDACVNYCTENGFANKVSFMGVRNDVPQLLNALDAFIYATDHDTFGIAVVEALACRLPVFVNDWAVMTEITADGKLATLYKTKDETDLFRHFSLYLHNKVKFVAKAKDAQREVKQKYSIEQHIANLKKMYLLIASKIA